MKNNKLMTAVCSLLVAGGVQAQTIYDANRFMGDDLNGTARFVGMGGAMGALGGDITTMGTNPAGIGIYRSNDFMLSFGFNAANTESDFQGSVMNGDRTKASFDNVGFVYSSHISNKGVLRFLNFGFNYRKIKNFNKQQVMSGTFGVSQTDQMASLCNRDYIDPTFPRGVVEPNDLNAREAFIRPYIPWLGALGYEGQLINLYKENETFDVYKGYLAEEDAIINGLYKSRQTGGVNVYDFNMSFNIKDRFYIGATVGAYDVSYRYNSSYSETFYVNNQNMGTYTLNNNLKTDGAGVDFKLGFILRPSDSFPLRIGFAIHTPVFYNLTDWNFADLSYDTYNPDDGKFYTGSTMTQDESGNAMDGRTDYKLVTPWKYNVSLGYTVGKMVAIGAEYEFEDHSSAKLKYDSDGYTENMDFENGMIKDMLKGVHTVRLGVEVKPVAQFAVRAGYNHRTAAFTDDAFKLLPNNSVRTDTEYANTKALNNYTLGIGYRGKMFYADLAYQFSSYKSDFYPFDNTDLSATKVKNERHQMLMTLGVRF